MLKKIILTFCLLTSLAVGATVADTMLVRFDLTHFADWTYHRSDVTLNNTLIQQNRLLLFTSSSGESYSLESPVFVCNGVDSLKIQVNYRTSTLPIDPAKLGLLVDLLDSEQTSVSQAAMPVTGKDYEYDLATMIAVPASGQFSLLFSAPEATLANSAAIRTIKVWAVGGSPVDMLKGDVTGDGLADVSDINALINIILGKESPDLYEGRAYLTDDDLIDVADINECINGILGR